MRRNRLLPEPEGPLMTAQPPRGTWKSKGPARSLVRRRTARPGSGGSWLSGMAAGMSGSRSTVSNAKRRRPSLDDLVDPDHHALLLGRQGMQGAHEDGAVEPGMRAFGRG